MYHINCFIENFRPNNFDWIRNFDSLEIEDQIKIHEKMDEVTRQSSTDCKRLLETDDVEIEVKKAKQANSLQLPIKVQDLVRTLYESNSLTQTTLAEIELNEREKTQSAKNFQSALDILSEISDLIKGDQLYCDFLSSKFFNLIPCNFPIEIDTLVKVEKMRKLVESLKSIETSFLQVKHEINIELDPVERLYERLECDISLVNHETEEFSIIERYLTDTSGHARKLTLNELFEINRKGESLKTEKFKHLTNRRLLWHGSQPTNFVGILKHGLKVAPPEALHTGHSFGRGIYFADMAEKSSVYSLNHSAFSKSGFMVLCEVALGDVYEVNVCSSYRLPEGKNSLKAVGQISPPSCYVQSDRSLSFSGTLTKTEESLQHPKYNEYVIFDPAQVRVMYLASVGISTI